MVSQTRLVSSAIVVGALFFGATIPGRADTKPLGPETPSATRGQIITSVTIDDLKKILQDNGYRAEIAQGSRRPYIRTGISGRKVAIYLYDCEQDKCGSYQFSLEYFKTDTFNIKFANAWNLKKRFAKAYLNEKGEMLLEWDVSMKGGVAPDFVKESILSFERFVGIFDNFEP